MSKDKKEKHKGKGKEHGYEPGAADEGSVTTLVEEETQQGKTAAAKAEAGETPLPAIFTPQLEGDYRAAFDEEIATPAFMQQAFLAQLAPCELFSHHGRVRLTETGLAFEGLIEIAFADMVRVHAHVDRVYHRYYAGLAALAGRGHIHALTGGEPFVITFRDGERERSLYAVLDWPFFLALSKEKGWRKAVGGLLPAKEKKK